MAPPGRKGVGLNPAYVEIFGQRGHPCHAALQRYVGFRVTASGVEPDWRLLYIDIVND